MEDLVVRKQRFLQLDGRFRLIGWARDMKGKFRRRTKDSDWLDRLLLVRSSIGGASRLCVVGTAQTARSPSVSLIRRTFRDMLQTGQEREKSFSRFTSTCHEIFLLIFSPRGAPASVIVVVMGVIAAPAIIVSVLLLLAVSAVAGLPWSDRWRRFIPRPGTIFSMLCACNRHDRVILACFFASHGEAHGQDFLFLCSTNS